MVLVWWWFNGGGVVFFFLSIVAYARGWGRERKRKREREIVKNNNKKEYLNKLGKKNRVWDVRCIIKWYSINDKVTFWDGKIEYDDFSGCECSK